MAVSAADVRLIVERVCTRPDVLAACRKRDIGFVIDELGANGVTQGRISALTGIPQGRLSEYMNRKRSGDRARASTLEKFADGMGLPPVARQALGVSGTPSNLGVDRGDQPSPIGLAYPEAPSDAADNVSDLWRRDLGDPATLHQGKVLPSAWADASVRWLVDPGTHLDRDHGNRVHIGIADVDRFRVTVEMFAKLDDQFGGGHARQSLIQYLSTDGERLLRGRYPEAIGRKLFSAVGEASLLAAWMTYDSAPTSSLAQRYFIQALALAQAGDDRLLGASILDAMSHQATHIGRFGEAATLARAARTGTSQIATPTLTAHFHLMEARALARLGDKRGCDLALAHAVQEFERRNPADDPSWFQYVDETELSAEFGHCLRDLGRVANATQYAQSCLPEGSNATFIRSDFFVAMVLADAQLAAGDLEQACNVALRALAAGEQIRSARCINYLREFRQHLTRAANTTLAVEFSEQARASRLWRIACRPDKGSD